MLVGTKVVGKRRAVWIAIGGIVLYTLLVGGDAAVVRAAIMGGLFVLALYLGRQAEVRNQLSLGLAYIVCQKLIPRKDGQGRLVAMEILNNNYACANLIRTGKIEQIYTQLQTKTQDKPDQKMCTMESHLVRLVNGEADLAVGDEWVLRHEIKQYLRSSAGQLELLPRPLDVRDLHIAVSRQHPRHERIIADFDAAIAAMREDGTFQKIIDSHVARYMDL